MKQDLNVELSGPLMSKFPELASALDIDRLVAVDAALEEVQSAVDQLKRGSAMHTGDYDGLLQTLSDWQEMFRHLEEHCREAVEALRVLSQQAETQAEHTEPRTERS